MFIDNSRDVEAQSMIKALSDKKKIMEQSEFHNIYNIMYLHT